MADSFGLKIGLEGEKEFKKSLAEINNSFNVLGSEMKLATSQFDKNDKSVEALAARNKVLQNEFLFLCGSTYSVLSVARCSKGR